MRACQPHPRPSPARGRGSDRDAGLSASPQTLSRPSPSPPSRGWEGERGRASQPVSDAGFAVERPVACLRRRVSPPRRRERRGLGLRLEPQIRLPGVLCVLRVLCALCGENRPAVRSVAARLRRSSAGPPMNREPPDRLTALPLGMKPDAANSLPVPARQTGASPRQIRDTLEAVSQPQGYPTVHHNGHEENHNKARTHRARIWTRAGPQVFTQSPAPPGPRKAEACWSPNPFVSVVVEKIRQFVVGDLRALTPGGCCHASRPF